MSGCTRLPVAVQRVLQPVQFEGEEITEADGPLPPLPPPPNPPTTGRRRLKAKSAPVAERGDWPRRAQAGVSGF